MAIKDDIYTFISSQAAITALVAATNIGWVDCDEETDYPRIVYYMVSDPPLYEANDRWQRWRFFAYSDLKDECLDIVDVLDSTLHQLQNTTMGDTYIDFVSRIDRSEVVRQELIYEAYIDFRIIYH